MINKNTIYKIATMFMIVLSIYTILTVWVTGILNTEMKTTSIILGFLHTGMLCSIYVQFWALDIFGKITGGKKYE